MTDLSTVSDNLAAIIEMAGRLEARAIDQGHRVASSGDRGIPGGDALVNLASVGSLSAWKEQFEAAEWRHEADPMRFPPAESSTEDPDEWWPAIQILWFWSESLRAELGMDYADDPHWRPSLVSEARFLRNRDVAEWIWSNEPHWDDYAADVQSAHDKLEAVLLEGTRVAFRGVSCMYEDCKGARLVRKTVPAAGKDGNKVWRLTDWHCPKCKRSWTEERYESNIYAAIQRDKIEQPDNDDAEWCTVDLAASRVGRPQGTVRAWISRNQVGAACFLRDQQRRTFVRYDDVEERDELAKARRARSLAGMRAKLVTTV